MKKGFVSTYSFKHFDFLQLQRLQPSISPTGSDLRLHIEAQYKYNEKKSMRWNFQA